MIGPRIWIGPFLLLVLSVAMFSQKVAVREVPAHNTWPADGEQMYKEYCASCHGLLGTGSGPAAPAMKIAPTDLTMLTKNNHGEFPALHVQNVILGDEGALSSHGSQDMPVWGDTFRGMCINPTTCQAERLRRVAQLSKYLEALQVR